MDISSTEMLDNTRAVSDSAIRRSVYSDGMEEAARFKWIESEKAGRDLGEVAIRHWVRIHWSGFLRARWLDHLQGKCFWIELDRGDFGLLTREFQEQRELLGQIIDFLKLGYENLGVIAWAESNHITIGPVRDILTAIDINSCRLAHKFDE